MTKNISLHYYSFSKEPLTGQFRVSAIDTEWAKNWRAVEKFVPFSLAVHSIYFDDNPELNMELTDLGMTSELCFRGRDESTTCFLARCDKVIGNYLKDGTTILGHQLSSDLHTMLYTSEKPMPSVERLIKMFRQRTKPINPFGEDLTVADTRYDIRNRIKGEEKLRSVSLRLGVIAIQTELDGTSLTKLYNTYTLDYDTVKREMLMVLNWRHAFQTSLVWLVDSVFPNAHMTNCAKGIKGIETNPIMAEMGSKSISYLRSTTYLETMSRKGIEAYNIRYRKKP